MITILTDNMVAEVGHILVGDLSSKGELVKHFVLEESAVKPCYACGGCKSKSFKRCAFRDDADLILPYIAQSDTVIVVSPIVYGGYSFKIKRVIDKFALIGDLHYYVNQKEIVKGEDPSMKNYYVVGVSKKNDITENNAFDFLVRETLLLTNWAGKSIICDAECNPKEIIGEILSCKTS